MNLKGNERRKKGTFFFAGHFAEEAEHELGEFKLNIEVVAFFKFLVDIEAAFGGYSFFKLGIIRAFFLFFFFGRFGVRQVCGIRFGRKRRLKSFGFFDFLRHFPRERRKFSLKEREEKEREKNTLRGPLSGLGGLSIVRQFLVTLK